MLSSGMNHGQAQLPLSADSVTRPDPAAQWRAEYRRLVRVELPQAALAGRWSLRLDHCFARVILDALFGSCWYDHLARGKGRSAESQLDAAHLRRAVALARGMLKDGDAEVRRLNAQSLRWRGKHFSA